VALFTADNGRNYAAYANQIWNKLVESNDSYAYVGETELPSDNETDMQLLYEVFHRMEVEILQTLQKKSDARLKALDFQRQRAERIGIINIRTGRIRKIDEERQQYLDNMRRTQSVVPDVKNIIKVRIDG
jgi:hypothetical protein